MGQELRFLLWKLKCFYVDPLTLPRCPVLICPWLWNLDEPSNFLDKCKFNRYFLSTHSVPGSWFHAGDATVILKPLPLGTFSLVGWPLPCSILELPSQSLVLTGYASFIHSANICGASTKFQALCLVAVYNEEKRQAPPLEASSPHCELTLSPGSHQNVTLPFVLSQCLIHSSS